MNSFKNNTSLRLLKKMSIPVFSILTLIYSNVTFAAELKVPTDYTTIQAAINAASDNDVINVAAGTYDENLKIDKKISIKGEGDSTVINLGTGTGNNSGQSGMLITASDVTLDSFKIISSGTTYALKATSIYPSVKILENITLKDISIKGGKGLNVHGVNNVIIDGVKVFEPTKNGVNIALAVATNVTISNTTTSGGAWGDIGVMFANNTQYPHASSITFGNGNNFGVGFVYAENFTDSGNPFLTAPFSPAVMTVSQDNKVVYTKTPFPATITKDDVNYGYVTIQEAINAAELGDTIKLAEGTFPLTESLAINKSLSFVGVDSKKSIIDGKQNGKNGVEIGLGDYDISFSNIGFTNIGSTTFGTGIFVSKPDATNSFTGNLSVTNCSFSNIGKGAIVANGGELVVDGCYFDMTSPELGRTPNAIQVGRDCIAEITNNYVQNSNSTHTSWTGVGILITYSSNGQKVQGNTLVGCDIGVSVDDYYTDYSADDSTLDPLAETTNTFVSCSRNVSRSVRDFLSENELFVGYGYEKDSIFHWYMPKEQGTTTIQAAIEKATAGNIIHISAGEYAEQLNVNKNLTFKGAKYGVDARTRSLVDSMYETRITKPMRMQAGSSGTEFNGLYFLYSGVELLGEKVTVYHDANVNDIKYNNNVFVCDSFDPSQTPAWGTYKGLITITGGNNNISIDKCYFAGFESAIYLNPGATGLNIANNKIEKCKQAIRPNGTKGVITGNEMIDCASGIELRTSNWGTKPLGTGCELTVSNNTFKINTTTPWYAIYSCGDQSKVVLSRNIFEGYPATVIENITVDSALNASSNYWGSATPNFAQLVKGNVTYYPYYSDRTMTNLVQNPYLIRKSNVTVTGTYSYNADTKIVSVQIPGLTQGTNYTVATSADTCVGQHAATVTLVYPYQFIDDASLSMIVSYTITPAPLSLSIPQITVDKNTKTKAEVIAMLLAQFSVNGQFYGNDKASFNVSLEIPTYDSSIVRTNAVKVNTVWNDVDSTNYQIGFASTGSVTVRDVIIAEENKIALYTNDNVSGIQEGTSVRVQVTQISDSSKLISLKFSGMTYGVDYTVAGVQNANGVFTTTINQAATGLVVTILNNNFANEKPRTLSIALSSLPAGVVAEQGKNSLKIFVNLDEASEPLAEPVVIAVTEPTPIVNIPQLNTMADSIQESSVVTSGVHSGAIVDVNGVQTFIPPVAPYGGKTVLVLPDNSAVTIFTTDSQVSPSKEESFVASKLLNADGAEITPVFEKRPSMYTSAIDPFAIPNKTIKPKKTAVRLVDFQKGDDEVKTSLRSSVKLINKRRVRFGKSTGNYMAFQRLSGVAFDNLDTSAMIKETYADVLLSYKDGEISTKNQEVAVVSLCAPSELKITSVESYKKDSAMIVKGMHLGGKPKAYIEYRTPSNQIKIKTCKVIIDEASREDGIVSQIRVIAPKMPKNIHPYNPSISLIIDNGLGLGKAQGTVTFKK